MRNLYQRIAGIALMAAAIPVCAASSCANVDRSLTQKRKDALAPVIARQLQVKSVKILESFQVDGWTILYVEPSEELDPVYLFYAHNPLTNHRVTEWAGMADENESKPIED